MAPHFAFALHTYTHTNSDTIHKKMYKFKLHRNLLRSVHQCAFTYRQATKQKHQHMDHTPRTP